MKRAKKSRPSKLLRRLKAQKLSVKQITLLYAICLVATGMAAAVIATISRAPDAIPDPYRQEQREAVDFTLYYPNELPAGYEIDISSLGRVEQAIVNLRIRNTAGQQLAISQQKVPENFDFSALYNSFAERQSEKLPLGEATIGIINNDDTRLVSLVTDSTWILVQAPRDIENATVLEILSHFEASK